MCEELDWRKPDGGLKEMSCRVALLRMQADGLVHLPAPLHRNSHTARARPVSAATDPQPPLECPVGELRRVRLEPVVTRHDSRLWNEYTDRYHYLGYQPLPGAQLRYFSHADEGVLGLLGVGAAAWKTAPRDKFIGWSAQQHEARLRRVVNNARFLILPWVRSKHLDSKLLGLAARRLPDDWLDRYGSSPVLARPTVVRYQKDKITVRRAPTAPGRYCSDC